MGDVPAPTSDALRAAHRDTFTSGLLFATLENLQERSSSTGTPGRDIAFGAVKALLMVAPFAGLLAPVGNIDYGWHIASDGFQGGALRTVALACFWAGAVGQAWVLAGWFREGRVRDTYWVGSSVAAAACSALALWWFPSLLHPLAFQSVRVPIVLTGLLGLLVLVLQLVASTGGRRWERQRLVAGERLRSLPEQEQDALLAERHEILAALRSRGLVDERLEQRAAAARLGDWWLLDRERAAAQG